MRLHHHKAAFSITTILVALIAVSLGLQADAAVPDSNTLLILSFTGLLVLLVLNFVIFSILLRTRDELHQLGAKLHERLEAGEASRASSQKRRRKR